MENKSIKCGLCGYAFKTISKVETRIHDYEPCQETVWYPDPKDPNPAHMLRNYVCDKCYKDIDRVVRQNLIREGEIYTSHLGVRIAQERRACEDRLNKLEAKNKEIKGICEKLENINHLFELTPKELEQIKKYENDPFNMYYIDNAITIDSERVRKEKTVTQWMDLFGVKIQSLAKGVTYSDMVTVQQFRNLLQDCVFNNFTYRDMFVLLEKIDKYIESNN